MSQENLVFNSLRMNMNNPQHAKINEVLCQVDKDVCKSKNQFILDAIEYYVDHFGQESFVKSKDETVSYISRNDIDLIKAELMDAAMTEARREVIRILGTAVMGRNVPLPATEPITKESGSTENVRQKDDDTVAGLASEWIVNTELEE